MIWSLTFWKGIWWSKGNEDQQEETQEICSTADETARDGVQVSRTSIRRGEGIFTEGARDGQVCKMCAFQEKIQIGNVSGDYVTTIKLSWNIMVTTIRNREV